MLRTRNNGDRGEGGDRIYNTSILISQGFLCLLLRRSCIQHHLFNLAAHILCILHKARK